MSLFKQIANPLKSLQLVILDVMRHAYLARVMGQGEQGYNAVGTGYHNKVLRQVGRGAQAGVSISNIILENKHTQSFFHTHAPNGAKPPKSRFKPTKGLLSKIRGLYKDMLVVRNVRHIIFLGFVLLVLSGCEICQPVGNYEECVEAGMPACVDMYPKCEG